MANTFRAGRTFVVLFATSVTKFLITLSTPPYIGGCPVDCDGQTVTSTTLFHFSGASEHYDSIKLYTTLICFEAIQDINKANKHYIVLNSNSYIFLLF